MSEVVILSLEDVSKIIQEVFSYKPFNDFYLRAEVQNISQKGKYIYITLIDSKKDGPIEASLTAVVSPYCDILTPDYKIGDTLIMRGSLSYYKARGTVSFWPKTLAIDGQGNELLRLKKLMEKLEKEGLFDEDHKRPLPEYPSVIGVVTSSEGAAIRDIKSTLEKRYPVKVKVFSALVQGEKASESLVKAINEASKDESLDLLIITRGGGSKADLAPFNDEMVARLIYDFKVPVISAVGHKIDTSITDLVADKSAITPTDAANLVGKSLDELLFVRENAKSDLKRYLDIRLKREEEKLRNYSLLITSYSPKNKIQNKIEALIKLKELLNASMKEYINGKLLKIEQYKAILAMYNDEKIAQRGYIYALKDRKIIKSIDSLAIEDTVTLKFKDGDVITKVKEKVKHE